MIKKALATAFVILLCSAALRADVTITMVTTVQGGMAAMAGANASPTMVTRIKGQKARMDMEVMNQTFTTLADLAAKQVTLLRADEKTAQILAGPGAAAPAIQMPNVDATFKPTGQSRNIDGISCDEFAFSFSMSMGGMSGGQMPPEAAEAMKDLQMAMSGSVWVAKSVPGAAEYVAFQKAAMDANLAGFMTAGMSGMGSMDKVMRAMQGGQGIPYLTEMTMTIDGSGQVADMMRQAGPMTITMKVSKIATDPIADELLTVPADYKVIKQ